MQEYIKAISSFLISDKKVTLKNAFDNLGNYVICFGIFALAFWLETKMHSVTEIIKNILFWLLSVVASFLLVLNILQSFLIVNLYFANLKDFFIYKIKKGNKVAYETSILNLAIILFTSLFYMLIASITISIAYGLFAGMPEYFKSADNQSCEAKK